MLVTLPIYVEVRRAEGRPQHVCRPVFLEAPTVADAQLGLALNRLRRRLKLHLDGLGSLPRHELLAAALLNPPLEARTLRLTLDLRDRQVKVRLLWVVFPALDRRIAFTPSLPRVWCELQAGETLEARAVELLENHYRRLAKDRSQDEQSIKPESVSLEGQAWITSIDLDVNTRQLDQRQLERKFAALFDSTKPNGAYELQSVGRCLDWLYPDELLRGVGRKAEADELTRLLAAPDRRPVAIVGPRLVGKSTVIHEAVRRRVRTRSRTHSARENVWLLSPQRLVSGMSYVGQWEGRTAAILREAARRRHVLYFDDFLGLYQAGVCRDAGHSIADMLKPYVLRRDVRVLAEMTPEAWQAFQERDRGLADQFQVLRVAPTDERRTRRILLDVHRRLEAEFGCSFTLDALPAVLQLNAGYIRDAAFPGKAAAFSRRLAQKLGRRAIARSDVYAEFQAQTGLSATLIDERVKLQRDALVKRLSDLVVGQPEAVEAAADVVVVAKARLADPRRPLATLLLLGPTGVGKTQCAKALAEVMFEDPQRLVRFDMNEFVTAHAASRLAGSPDEPEGLLTSAVRRQPFCILLLDEIEKAHPDVFDLLLQLLGEGRLTDAQGRTTDFSNTVVVMTSNLGASAGKSPLGLASAEDAARRSYVKAAESFFRPEFFNRIDRILPFAPLDRDAMHRIARLVLDDVLRREGLVRRRCALSVDPPAMERIVDAGYHPQFGARALKREIERRIVQPAAARLAQAPSDLPTLVRVRATDAGVESTLTTLRFIPPVAPRSSLSGAPDDAVRQARDWLDRFERRLTSDRPVGSSAAGGVSRAQLRYYALKEQALAVRRQIERLETAIEHSKRRPNSGVVVAAPRPPAEKVVIRQLMRPGPSGRQLRENQQVQDIADYLQETAGLDRVEPLDLPLAELLDEVALLHSLDASADRPDRALLTVVPLVSGAEIWQQQLFVGLMLLAKELSYDCQTYQTRGVRDRPPTLALLISGLGISPLAEAEAGVHLRTRPHDSHQPLQVEVRPADERPIAEQVAVQIDERAVDAHRPADESDDGRVVRCYEFGGATLDLRTGRTLGAFPTPAQWKRLLLAGLPLPPDWEVGR